MSTRLADRLSGLRRERVVGRQEERALFLAALAAPELPYNVLHVHGPGGVGKTTLLREFQEMCDEREVRATRLDARNFDPAPDAFLRALGAGLGVEPSCPTVDWLAAQRGRQVILVDTYELLKGLDAWVREGFLPQLPSDVLVVLAGRNPPEEGWRSDPGWQALVRTLPLRNLSPEESRSYLAKRQVPPESRQAALDFTHGHPLALSLVADLLEQRPERPFRAEEAPDVIRTLLDRFIQDLPSPLHRTALEAAALLRLTTESILEEVLDTEDAPALFDWLRGLSFIDSSPRGIFPHDLVREALCADLRWRNSERYALLHERARGYYSRRVAQTTGVEQQRTLWDYVYLHRDNPGMKPFLDWNETGVSAPDFATQGDRAALLAMVERHEGPESARVLEHWLRRQPGGMYVLRAANLSPAGFLAMVAVHEVTAEDEAVDPAIAAARRYLERHAPLRPGERATHFRFWLGAEDYQRVSPIQSLIFLRIAQHYLGTADLAFTFFPCADREFWAPLCSYIDLSPAPDAEYEVGGRTYAVYAHDWRVTPPIDWLALLAQREIGTEVAAGPPPRPGPAPALREEEFAAAVHDALRNYHRPRRLQENPLLRCRLVAARVAADTTPAERVAALRGVLRAGAESLRAAPREEKYYDALHHAFIHPASSQENAARILHVSFSTFRRHVKAGVEKVTEALWHAEQGGAAGGEQELNMN